MTVRLMVGRMSKATKPSLANHEYVLLVHAASPVVFIGQHAGRLRYVYIFT